MEQHRDLYMTFVDLTKAFDTVSREGLWNVISKFGCLDGMMARVLDDGNASEPFR